MTKTKLKSKTKSKLESKLEYKNLEMDAAFMAEMQTDILLQAFTGIIKSESYVELYPIMGEIHKELMATGDY